jgi:hypothetical protein
VNGNTTGIQEASETLLARTLPFVDRAAGPAQIYQRHVTRDLALERVVSNMSRLPAVRMRQQPIASSLWRGRLPDLTKEALGRWRGILALFENVRLPRGGVDGPRVRFPNGIRALVGLDLTFSICGVATRRGARESAIAEAHVDRRQTTDESRHCSLRSVSALATPRVASSPHIKASS